PLRGLNRAWCQAHVGHKGASILPQLVKLSKLKLIELRRVSLHNITDITEHNRTEEEEIPVPVMDELKGIANAFFLEVPASVQKSWLVEYGVDIIRSTVPTALEAFKTKPSSVPLVVYMRRWFEKEKEIRLRPKENMGLDFSFFKKGIA